VWGTERILQDLALNTEVNMSRVVHFEILSTTPESTAAFFEKAFGWKSNGFGGKQPYWLVTTGSEGPGINGGIMGRHFDQAVINTIEVPSLEETAKKIEGAGGSKVHGPNEIPGVGTHAYFRAPDGHLFGVLQPAPK
jgi:uncharacterized protein